jgi:hypothetical protein
MEIGPPQRKKITPNLNYVSVSSSWQLLAAEVVQRHDGQARRRRAPRNRPRSPGGQCYDQNFCDFRQFSAKKIGVFLINQCHDEIFAKFSFVLSQKRQFFRQIFWRKYFKNHNIGPWGHIRQLPTQLGSTLVFVPRCLLSSCLSYNRELQRKWPT